MLNIKEKQKQYLTLALISSLLCLLLYMSYFGVAGFLGKESTVLYSLKKVQDYKRVTFNGQLGFKFPTAGEQLDNAVIQNLLEEGLNFTLNGNFSYNNAAFFGEVYPANFSAEQNEPVFSVVVKDNKFYITSFIFENQVFYYDFSEELKNGFSWPKFADELKENLEIIDKSYVLMTDESGIESRYLAVDYQVVFDDIDVENIKPLIKITSFHNMENQIKRLNIDFSLGEEFENIVFWGDFYLDFHNDEQTFTAPTGEMIDLKEENLTEFNQILTEFLEQQ